MGRLSVDQILSTLETSASWGIDFLVLAYYVTPSVPKMVWLIFYRLLVLTLFLMSMVWHATILLFWRIICFYLISIVLVMVYCVCALKR